MANQIEPFIGSEAIERRTVTQARTRGRHYRRLFPDRLHSEIRRTDAAPEDKAGWLWSHRQGVIAGLTASALHGAKCEVDDSGRSNCCGRTRAGPGRRRYERMTSECAQTNSAKPTRMRSRRRRGRTRLDLARRKPLGMAVAHLDALGNATRLSAGEILRVAKHHPGSPGLPRLGSALGLYDPGAASPKETWLRLLVIRAGYPRPRTQIPVRSPDGRRSVLTSIWAGRRRCWRSNTTASNIASTRTSTRTTSAGQKISTCSAGPGYGPKSNSSDDTCGDSTAHGGRHLLRDREIS